MPEEENARCVRAPPNCNPFDMSASVTCCSLSCRVPVNQASYGRTRLNTATGIERPSCDAAGMIVRGNGCLGRKCAEQVRSNDSLLTDCRQHKDGCFSSHSRWLSMKEFTENRTQFDSRPVVYVPVLCETVHTNIRRTVEVSSTSGDSDGEIKLSSSFPSSSPSQLLQHTATSICPSTSTIAYANVDTITSDYTPIPANHNAEIVAQEQLSARSNSPEKKEKVEM